MRRVNKKHAGFFPTVRNPPIDCCIALSGALRTAYRDVPDSCPRGQATLSFLAAAADAAAAAAAAAAAGSSSERLRD
jgi:hypothetical protein